MRASSRQHHGLSSRKLADNSPEAEAEAEVDALLGHFVGRPPVTAAMGRSWFHRPLRTRIRSALADAAFAATRNLAVARVTVPIGEFLPCRC
jgi:hypothetical protein